MSDSPRAWARALRGRLHEVATTDHAYMQGIDSKHHWPIDGKKTWLEVLVDLNLVAALNGSPNALDRILTYTAEKPAQRIEGAGPAGEHVHSVLLTTLDARTVAECQRILDEAKTAPSVVE